MNPSPLYDLHLHLYGALRKEDLAWLAGRRPPRWPLFVDSFRRQYGTEPRIESLFDGSSESEALIDTYFYYRQTGGFDAFQTRFDFVIALSHTDPEELEGVARRVVGRQREAFAEYRMMFSPVLTDGEYMAKCEALAEGMALAHAERPEAESRLAISLLRDPERARSQYVALRNLMKNNPRAAKYITGIDFCGAEEGSPPGTLKELFALVRADNEREPERALALLPHVGESYEDKSVESAVRWVVEAAEQGAHRLGHAVALGVNPGLYSGTTRSESPRERAHHIDFLLERYGELYDAGAVEERSDLERERDRLSRSGGKDAVFIQYDKGRVERLRRFQDWAMGAVRDTGAVVESCPTSNLRIARLEKPEHHPLFRFLEAGVPTVLGSDDPGILDTSLEGEFSEVRAWRGYKSEYEVLLKETARNSLSEILSGRK